MWVEQTRIFGHGKRNQRINGDGFVHIRVPKNSIKKKRVPEVYHISTPDQKIDIVSRMAKDHLRKSHAYATFKPQR